MKIKIIALLFISGFVFGCTGRQIVYKPNPERIKNPKTIIFRVIEEQPGIHTPREIEVTDDKFKVSINIPLSGGVVPKTYVIYYDSIGSVELFKVRDWYNILIKNESGKVAYRVVTYEFEKAKTFVDALHAMMITGVIEAKITEQQILALLMSLETAAIEKDVKGTIDLIADDAVIRIVLPGPQGSQILNLTVKQYETYLDLGYRVMTNYEYERRDTKIRIAPDGRSAKVTCKLFESVTVGNQKINSVTQESARLELRSGRLVFTELDAIVVDFK